MRGVLTFLVPNFDVPTVSVYEDNQQAIVLAHPIVNKLIVRYHVLRELSKS